MTAAQRLEPQACLVTRDGATARLEQRDGTEALTVCDRRGHVLFEYDPDTGRGTFAVASDMRLCAPQGSIELVAAGGIRAVAGGEVLLSSATAATVAVNPTGDGAGSRLALDRDQAQLTAERLSVVSEETRLELGQTRALADTLHATIDRAELKFTTVLRRADRAIEQVGNLYQRVGELAELKAGRLRTLVKGSIWMKGNEVSVAAEDHVRIDGEHINLG